MDGPIYARKSYEDYRRSEVSIAKSINGLNLLWLSENNADSKISTRVDSSQVFWSTGKNSIKISCIGRLGPKKNGCSMTSNSENAPDFIDFETVLTWFPLRSGPYSRYSSGRKLATGEIKKDKKLKINAGPMWQGAGGYLGGKVVPCSCTRMPSMVSGANWKQIPMESHLAILLHIRISRRTPAWRSDTDSRFCKN